MLLNKLQEPIAKTRAFKFQLHSEFSEGTIHPNFKRELVQQVTIDYTVYKGNSLNIGIPAPSIIRLVSTNRCLKCESWIPGPGSMGWRHLTYVNSHQFFGLIFDLEFTVAA
jgi:hypothetical protein